MKIKNECIPCMVRQAVEAAELMSNDKAMQERMIKAGLDAISKIDFSETAPEVARGIHNMVKKITGNPDPYKELKDFYNRVATELVVEMALESKILESSNPFDTACRLSIAGNIIDFGVGIDLDKSDVHRSLHESLTSPLYGTPIEALKEAVERANRILVLADNSGEIVFDKLLMLQLPMERTTYVVKGGPMVNDATMEDALEVGMTDLVRVIDTGEAVQGTILKDCSEAFIAEFEAADLILSKGQANYETLSDLNDPRIFYLLRAKCKSIAEDIGCIKGSFVITQKLDA
ncbi:MAG: DUF89 family protein [Clostridia bacterium]|nr:DUF89 family protein [Clostridia bacterium]